MEYRLSQIAEITGGTLLGGDAVVTAVVTDSRLSAPGVLFVPLLGNTDGHNYIPGAVNLGACTLTERADACPEGSRAVLVKDTLKALGQIAAYRRQEWGGTVAAVTGSNGKTTTKELLSSVLGRMGKTHKNAGNFNNHIGVPLTLLAIPDDAEFAVVEMGMNHAGEIEYLTQMARPDIAVIVNSGMTHIEYLGSVENIAKAKLEIALGLPETGTLIVPADNAVLMGELGKQNLKNPIRTFGPGGDLTGKVLSDQGARGFEMEVTAGDERFTLHCPIPGLYNMNNVLAALSVAKVLGADAEVMAGGIEAAVPAQNRMEVIEHKKGYILINDTYNASPDSVRAALTVLSGMNARRRIAVLGDMLELGDHAAIAHAGATRSLKEQKIDLLFACGTYAEHYALGAKMSGLDSGSIRIFDRQEKLTACLQSLLKEGDVVLVKGSRGMKMENIVQALR